MELYSTHYCSGIGVDITKKKEDLFAYANKILESAPLIEGVPKLKIHELEKEVELRNRNKSFYIILRTDQIIVSLFNDTRREVSEEMLSELLKSIFDILGIDKGIKGFYFHGQGVIDDLPKGYLAKVQKNLINNETIEEDKDFELALTENAQFKRYKFKIQKTIKGRNSKILANQLLSIGYSYYSPVFKKGLDKKRLYELVDSIVEEHYLDRLYEELTEVNNG